MWLWIIVGLVLLIGLLLWWNSKKGKENEGEDMSGSQQSPEAPPIPPVAESPSPMESAPFEEPESSMPEQNTGSEDVEEEERPM